MLPTCGCAEGVWRGWGAPLTSVDRLVAARDAAGPTPGMLQPGSVRRPSPAPRCCSCSSPLRSAAAWVPLPARRHVGSPDLITGRLPPQRSSSGAALAGIALTLHASAGACRPRHPTPEESLLLGCTILREGGRLQPAPCRHAGRGGGGSSPAARRTTAAPLSPRAEACTHLS